MITKQEVKPGDRLGGTRVGGSRQACLSPAEGTVEPGPIAPRTQHPQPPHLPVAWQRIHKAPQKPCSSAHHSPVFLHWGQETNKGPGIRPASGLGCSAVRRSCRTWWEVLGCSVSLVWAVSHCVTLARTQLFGPEIACTVAECWLPPRSMHPFLLDRRGFRRPHDHQVKAVPASLPCSYAS